jgi:oxaloacetate decarboxylase (Na+ extruding) subunit alpha
MAAHFRESARAAGLPLGEPVEHDPFHYEHQVPGGMMTNLKAQLRQIGLETRLGEILVEIARVREELGYLNMVTPTSQLVGTQAVINVVRGERYAVVPEEVVKYALGWYGNPVAPLDPDVLDRILATPAARRFARREPLPPMIPEIRRRFGSHLSDEEVLLRIIFPEEHVRALLAAPPLEATAGGNRPDLLNLVRAVLGRGRAGSVSIEGDGVAVSARFA